MRCGLSKQNWDTRSDKNLVDLSLYLYIYVRAHILLRINVITYPPCIMSQQVTGLRAPHILTMHIQANTEGAGFTSLPIFILKDMSQISENDGNINRYKLDVLSRYDITKTFGD